MFRGIASTVWTKKTKWLALGLTFAFAMALSEQGSAVVFTQRTTTGSFGTMTFSGTLASTLDLTVTSIASTSTGQAAGVPGTPVTLTGAATDTVAFGNISATCAAATNGPCYLVTGTVAAHYVATLNAHFVTSGFATSPGLRVCRSSGGGADWPANQLLVFVGNGGTWTANPSNTSLTNATAGVCGATGITLIATAAGADVNQAFQIGGRVNAADVTSPSSLVYFEAF